jgi:purine nucleosidase
MANGKIPLLLDTDIGSDIDDAVCLAYLLRQPRCELLGVTTVSGRPRERAALADAVCRAAGRNDLPIHAGNDVGLLRGVVQPECGQAAILPRFPHREPEEFPPYTAVPFLREQIRRRPGEITLLAIGPMTNLGLLFSLDPEVPKLLKRLVLMCGVFTNRLAGVGPLEWNARCDPLATAMVYRAPAPEHVSIGLDVTCQCQLPCAEAIRRFREIGGPLSVVAAATEVWSKHAEKITFHDPLAATVCFQPDLCGYADGLVEVELKSERLAGMTHFDLRSGTKPHRVALSVQPEAFFQHYFGTASGAAR